MSFELKGRDADGVVAFTGGDRAPALLEWIAVLSLGLVFVSAIAAGGVAAVVRHKPLVLLASVPLALVFSWLTVGGSVWWLRVRRRLRGLTTIKDLSERTGVGETELQETATRTDVRPVYRVNSVDLYDPSRFAAGSLLRPTPAEERPVHSLTASHDDTLVKPSELP